MDQQWLQTYQREIGEFSEKISTFAQGGMDKKDYKGCSGGMGSYAQRDPAKHMLRLRLPAGRLTLERLSFLADTVEAYGVQRLKLTTCETIQLHDLAADQVPAILEQAAKAGIICRGGGGDNPRNVMCSPLSGVQQGEAFDPTPYAEAATEYLLSICRDIHMPRKLKIAFSNGADDSVHSAFRDMGFQAQADGTFSLRIAGGLGAARPSMGVLADGAVQPKDVLYYIKAMVDTFCRHGNYENRAKARTRFMQETLGPEGLKEAFLKNVEAAKAAGGLELPRPEALADVCGGMETLDHPRAIPQKQPGMYAVKYHPIGGLLPPEKPAELYAAIRDLCNAECRVGPDETLY
ncbi:MAG: nitrite/sulfite reductase, partial [Oscillibacter sp.]|nr:nitrite/sulfite reductase [Oscillibacter sp.]